MLMGKKSTIKLQKNRIRIQFFCFGYKAIPAGKGVPSLQGAVQGTGYGFHRYAEPKPPKGKSHKYCFSIYALDCPQNLKSFSTKKSFTWQVDIPFNREKSTDTLNRHFFMSAQIPCSFHTHSTWECYSTGAFGRTA